MGIPVNEIVHGADCFHWAEPTQTPSKAYAFFWDILKGDRLGAKSPANGVIFTMNQDPLSPCNYSSPEPNPGWVARFGLDASQSWLQLYINGGAPQYYFGHTLNVSPPPEFQLYINESQAPFGKYGYEGFGTVFWMERVLAVAADMGWAHLTDLMLEMFPVDGVDYVMKFCSHTIRQNIKIRFEP